MNRLGSLIVASSRLRRRIWASLPLSVRIAEVFRKEASFGTDAFGKVVYAEFLTHGIKGLPDINGRAAEMFDLSRKPVANRLPHGYGREFGESVYKITMAKFKKNREFVEEVMSAYLVRFLGGNSDHLHAGATLAEAKSYVVKGVINEGLNALRKKREVSDITHSDDGEESRMEKTVWDDDTANRPLEHLSPTVRSELRRIHPDAEQYLRLAILEGYKDREIFGDPERGVLPLLAHPTTSEGKPLNESRWHHYKKKIYDVMQRHFGDFPSAA